MSVACYTAVLPIFHNGDVGMAQCLVSSCQRCQGLSCWMKAFVCCRETCFPLIPGVCEDRWVSITAAGQSHRKLVLELSRRRDWDSCVLGRIYTRGRSKVIMSSSRVILYSFKIPNAFNPPTKRNPTHLSNRIEKWKMSQKLEMLCQ